MYIDSIVLTNIRGFSEVNFNFNRGNDKYAGWTVFVGNNGSGKSTFLKAVAIALTGTDTARALEPNYNRWIKEGRKGKSIIQLEIFRCEDDDYFSGQGKTTLQATFPARIDVRKSAKGTVLQETTPEHVQQNYSTPNRSIWSADAFGWFSCGYGPFRRVFGASPEAMRQMVAPTTERFVTMFQEAASLAEVDQWLRALSHKALEKKQSEKLQLDLLLEFLRSDLLPNEISVDGVDSDGLWLKDRNGVRLSWAEMSDGYRSALALLADIIRHLISNYGIDGLVGHKADGTIFVKRSGVVLIDEVDAHLHPEWQRNIGSWLKKHFPNIQFLVTTHSPLICQAADTNGIFVLPAPGSDEEARALTEEEYHKVIASRPDTILLGPAFGLQNTRSPEVVESRRQWAQLQAKKRAGATLTAAEKKKEKQLALFVRTDEEL